jgi:hypothetical protein
MKSAYRHSTGSRAWWNRLHYWTKDFPSDTDRQMAVHVYSPRRAVQALTGFLAASRVPDDHFYGTLSRIDSSDNKRDRQTSRQAED